MSESPFKPEHLHSEFYKLTLRDSKPTAKFIWQNTSPDESIFYVHKELLSSLSPEFSKHINNEMKEGKEGVIALSDIDPATMKAFLSWAYSGHYTAPKAIASSLLHVKVYVLGDRFNIIKLKDYAYSMFTSLLVDNPVGGIPGLRSDVVESVLEAAKYAFENLLLTSIIQPSPGVPQLEGAMEKLLVAIAQYIAWGLQAFRVNKGFSGLLNNCPDLGVALLSQVKPAQMPIWFQRDGNNRPVAVHSSYSPHKVYNRDYS